jgi:hypothetical protein
MTPTQRRVEMARTAYAAGLVILGVPKSARTDADFEAIVAIGLLLGHQSSMRAPLHLGAVLTTLLDKKRTFGWARSASGYKCLLCIVNDGGGKVDISCSNVEKNGGEQWVSHAKTHHSSLLDKTAERKDDKPPPPPAQSVMAAFARGGAPPSAPPSAAAASAGAGSDEAAAAAAAATSLSRADTGRNMARYKFVTAECDAFKALLVDCSNHRGITRADIGGQRAVKAFINSQPQPP